MVGESGECVAALDAVATIAARLHGKPKDEIAGVEVRQLRLRRALVTGGLTAITMLAAGATWAALSFFEQRNVAREQRDQALLQESRTLTAVASIETRDGRYLDAVNFALAAWPRDLDDNRPMLEATLNALGEAQRNQRQLLPPMRHEDTVSSAVFSQDETKILTSSDDGTARLFDAATGEELTLAMRHEGWVRSAVFSQDETKILTSSDDGTARLFDAATGEEMISAMRHQDVVLSAVFSQDETKILTRSSDGTARLFDAATGEELILAMRHEGWVRSAVFSQDETKILTSSDDGTARLFDAATGEELIPAMRHEGPVWRAVFSQDETKILTRSGGLGGGTARIWDISRLPKGDLFDLACRFYLGKGGLDLSKETAVGVSSELKIAIADPICASPPPRPDFTRLR